jgi:hypothetical protein
MTEASFEDKVLQQLESLGEDEVKLRFSKGKYGAPNTVHYSLVCTWLRSRESTRADALARESVSLSRSADSTAREALRIARREYTIAMIAAIAAVIAAIASIIGLLHH